MGYGPMMPPRGGGGRGGVTVRGGRGGGVPRGAPGRGAPSMLPRGEGEMHNRVGAGGMVTAGYATVPMPVAASPAPPAAPPAPTPLTASLLANATPEDQVHAPRMAICIRVCGHLHI